MSNLEQAIQMLQNERRRTEQELERISQALMALSAFFGKKKLGSRRKPKFSKAGLARIAAAQRKRWRKIKAGKK